MLLAAEIDEQETGRCVPVREEAPGVEAGLPAEPLQPLVRERVVKLGPEVEGLDLLDDVALPVGSRPGRPLGR